MLAEGDEGVEHLLQLAIVRLAGEVGHRICQLAQRLEDPLSLLRVAGVDRGQHDLALYLIARLCGREHAVRIAKVYLLEGHDDGQLPFAAMSRRIQTSDAVVAGCQTWLADNYACANPVTTASDV